MFIKLINDIFVIIASFIFGYALKFKLYVLGVSNYIAQNARLADYLHVLDYIIVLWLLAFIVSGMYRQFTGPLARMEEAKAIIKGVLLGGFEIMAFTFLYKSFPESRYVLVYSCLAAICLLTITRNILASIMGFAHKKGLGNIKAAIIGHSDMAQRIAEKIHYYPEYGFNYVGFINTHKPKNIIHPLKDSYKLLGETEHLPALVKKYGIGALFLADETLPLDKLHSIARFCRDNNIYFRFTPSKYQFKQFSVNFDALDTIPLLKITRTEFSILNRILKRLFDLALTIPLLIIFLPIMGLICLLIRFTSAGEIIYKQKRVTLNGQEFDFYKFRSMKADAERGKPILSVKDQSDRTTRIGNFLRKTSLDELPQLFNVLKGDMSIVGPRPERPFFHDKYKKSIPRWEDRLAVRGGITGWAQINGRAQLSNSPLEKLEYDLYYISNWSIFFDIKVILNTILLVLRQKDVY